MKQRTPLPPRRLTPRRRAPERVSHTRIKPKAGAEPNAAERRHMDRIAALPCLVTGSRPVVLHHVMKCPGKAKRRDHRFVVPLIPALHNMGNLSVHLLGSEAEFLRVHGVDLAAEAQRLWKESEEGNGSD